MGRAHILQSNFTSGELTPRVTARSDLQRFFSGLLLNENFWLLTQGGLKKRMGTLCDGLCLNNNRPRLVEFFKSVNDVLIFELTDYRLRIWQSDYSLVMDGLTPYEVVTPWPESELDNLSFTQASDVIFVSNINCTDPPRVILRYANDNVVIQFLEYKNGPFLGGNGDNVTITPSGLTGAITLNASASLFSPDKVGSLFRFRENLGNPPMDKWEPAKSITAGMTRQNAGRVYKATNSATTGTTPPIHSEGTVSDGAVLWQFVHDGAGIAKITSYSSVTNVGADVISELPSLSATNLWEEGAFSDANGYPACLSIHQERLFAGQTLKQPDTIFASVTEGYSSTGVDFKPGLGTGLVVDSDAVRRTVTGGQVRPILHLVSAGALYGFTPKTIEVISGPSEREPITPSGAAAISRPGSGAHPKVFPVLAPSEILYVSNNGRSLLALPWSEKIGDGIARNLSILTEHIGKLGSFKRIELIESPEPCIFVLNEYGRLFGVAYSPEQEVVGWWRIVFDDAEIESICKMRRPNGDDELWLGVKRIINGNIVRTIEHMPQFLLPYSPRDYANYLDGAYYWDLWNDEDNEFVTIDSAPIIGASGEIVANHNLFSSGDIGTELWLRIDAKIEDSLVSMFPVKLKITDVASATIATFEAITNIPNDFVNVPLNRFAKPISQLENIELWKNAQVKISADGEDLGDINVNNSGTAIFPRLSARGFIGAQFNARIRLMPLDIGNDIGTNVGAKIRVDRFSIVVRDAVKLLAGPKNGPFEPINVRNPKDIMSRPAQPSDRTKTIPYMGEWGEIIDVEISAPGPFPCEIAGVSLRVSVND